jgi:hypothetical protein
MLLNGGVTMRLRLVDVGLDIGTLLSISIGLVLGSVAKKYR